MRPRTVTVALILGVTAVFAALNWETFSRPTLLNVVVGKIEAPLGVIMLILVAALSVVYLLLVARLETRTRLEERRTTKELDKARKLAESSEESRLRELRALLESEFDALHEKLDEVVDPAQRGQSRQGRRAGGYEGPEGAEPSR